MLGLHGENGPASWDEAMKDRYFQVSGIPNDTDFQVSHVYHV